MLNKILFCSLFFTAPAFAQNAGATLLSSKTETPEPTPELASKLTASPTYQRIRESGTIVLAVRETASPFSYNNGNDQFIGYTVDLCEHVVKAMRKELMLPNLKVVYLPVTGAERIEVVEKGYVDMECSSTTITTARSQKVNFSNAIFYSQSMFVGQKNKRLDRLDDLKGSKVAVAIGTIQETFLKELNEKRGFGIQITSYKNAQEAYLAVLNNSADFVSSDDLLLLGLKNSINDDRHTLRFFDVTYLPNTYGIMLPKNDPAFKEIVNKHLKDIFDTKKAHMIYDKWFMNNIPPKYSSLNWPLGKTQDLFDNPTSTPLLP